MMAIQIRQESGSAPVSQAMKPQRFGSFDEFAVALGHPDMRLIALGRPRASWQSRLVDLDGVLVRQAQDGGPCLYELSIAADGVAFMVGVDADGKITGNGTVMGPASVLVVPGRTEIRSTSLAAVRWISTFIPASRLNSAIGRDHGATCRASVTRDTGYFRRLLGRVANAAATGAFERNPLGERHAADQLAAAAARELIRAPRFDGINAHVGRPRISRDQVVGRVQEWLEEHPDKRPSLDDLARAAGVSDRTLRNAFQEQLGTSPKRFLRLRLLNVVHHTLRRADPEATRVTDVLAQQGVWDWGHFARDYRTLFGELPSKTLSGLRRRETGNGIGAGTL